MGEKLDILETAFISAITDKDNPKTFNNATQSYKSVRPYVTTGTAETQGCRVLGRDRVQKAIAQILEDNGCRIEDRVLLLSQISQGTQTRKTKIYRIPRDKEGKQIGTEPVLDSYIETEPTFNERTKAIDIMSKLLGDYARIDVAKQIAVDEYSKLKGRLYKLLRDSAGNTPLENAPGSTQGGEGL